MMKKINLITCLIFISFTLFPQQKIKLWEGKNVTKKEKRSELIVFLPEKPDSSGISIIICPGGSYFWLDMDNEGTSVAKYLNKYGIAAFVLKYRTAMHGNHHPAMIQDLERAMYLVKQSANEYKINLEKVGVMGFSAGGHLAGTAAIYSEGQLKPYFAAMIYPVVSMEDSICHKKSRRNLLGNNYSNELKEKMSLEKNVYAGMPPVFLLHCINDKTVDYRNSVIFDKALTTKNVKHKFLLFDKCEHHGHGFGIKPSGEAKVWINEFISWVLSNMTT